MNETRDAYSPERRTALLFTGTGADGAYHAGAMRAIQEAGVKIDVVGGRGIGAVAAVLGAVDGGSQLWDFGGFWRSPAVETFYRWRWPFAVLRWLGIALLAVLAIPAAIILLGLVVYPIALVLGMVRWPPALPMSLNQRRTKSPAFREYPRFLTETTNVSLTTPDTIVHWTSSSCR